MLIKGLGLGGAERLVAESAAHWSRDEFDYQVAYVLPWKDQLVAAIEQAGVGVLCLGGPRGSVIPAWTRLRKLVRAESIDLIHAHLPVTGLMGRLLPGGPPVVYTEHNLQSAYRQPTKTLNRLTYRLNAAVVGVSDAVVDSGGAGGMTMIPNGVEPLGDGASGDVRAELGIGADVPLVVHVGNIRPGKGHDDLVEVARHLRSTHPEVRVVSIGGEKYSGDLARVRAAAADLDGTMAFLGRRDDARRFIAAADVYVNPAAVEGLPVTILEAMAAGRPVVATAVGGVPEIVEDGVTGRLVPPHQPNALAESVAELLDDTHLADRLGAAGAALVGSRYGIAAMVSSYECLYRRLLG